MVQLLWYPWLCMHFLTSFLGHFSISSSQKYTIFHVAPHALLLSPCSSACLPRSTSPPLPIPPSSPLCSLCPPPFSHPSLGASCISFQRDELENTRTLWMNEFLEMLMFLTFFTVVYFLSFHIDQWHSVPESCDKICTACNTLSPPPSFINCHHSIWIEIMFPWCNTQGESLLEQLCTKKHLKSQLFSRKICKKLKHKEVLYWQGENKGAMFANCNVSSVV